MQNARLTMQNTKLASANVMNYQSAHHVDCTPVHVVKVLVIGKGVVPKREQLLTREELATCYMATD
jgi:hypothetical protein